MRFEDIEWSSWVEAERATLLFVVRDGRILLIRKKRGLGAGKVNGPGGRVHDGETAREAAVRETEEELLVRPLGVAKRGEVLFDVVGGTSIRIHVFSASDCEGDAQETTEAVPMWTPIDRVPYDSMWEDDELWMPHLLAGRKFEARTLFDGDRLIGHEILILPDDHQWSDGER